MLPVKRPVFLNLLAIQLPIGGLVSFAHRVSGVLWVLAIPALIYLLELSLSGPAGYTRALELLQSVWVWPAAVVLTLGLSHHLLAGLRFLAMDIGVGEQLPTARRSAYAVAWLGVLLALVVSVALWW